ncbi:glycosyltransferase family 4 protein [Rahnella aceris]|nr:imidazoleglycerol phosphate dehydratase [Campylobacter jejuni]
MLKNAIILTNEYYPFKGGIGRYCEEVIREIKDDFSVTLVAPKYDGSLRGHKLSDGLELNLINGGQFKYWHLPRLVNTIRSIDFSKYDKVLVADWPFWIAICFVNRYLPWKKKIDFSLMLHGSEVLNLKNGRASIFPKFINIFNGINNIYTNSNYTKEILFLHHNVPQDIPVEVTYLGVSQPETLNNDVYKESVDSNPLDLLSVGRLDDRKGYDHVINSIGLLPQNVRENIKYTIVGNGTDEFKTQLKSLADKQNVRIQILSGISDEELDGIYLRSNVFILAAKKNERKIEGFGLVFLEAAKYGVPSIATDVGAIKEVVKNGITGFVVKEDIEDISQAILCCYNDRDKLKYFSDNCISDVKNYKWSMLVRKIFRDLYA